jgi:Icc protein
VVVRGARRAAATAVELAVGTAPLFHVLHAHDPRVGEHLYLADASIWQFVVNEGDEV